MARMPGAIWRPLAANWDQMPRIKSWDIFCLHTMVGSLDGTDGYFRSGNGTGFTGTESHFGVGHDGTIYQWQDTAFQADANYRGGWHVISSENADIGTGFPKWNTNDGGAVPAFTPAQIEANAEIAAWLYHEHGIPLDFIPDSKVGRRGIGYHALGVPARKGDTVSQTGGELWSTANGKVCPGPRRIAQIPAISARAKQLAGGTPTPKGLFMHLSEAEERRILAAADKLNGNLGRFIEEIPRRVLTYVGKAGDVDEKAIAAALAPSVIAALGETTGISAEDVEAAVRRVLADAAQD